MLPPAVNIKKS